MEEEWKRIEEELKKIIQMEWKRVYEELQTWVDNIGRGSDDNRREIEKHRRGIGEYRIGIQ